ncbi:hypothetical protein RCOM_0128070 [Ricinus communis]|uniref:Uncharacterized protein n=1 Tax=Ricinus communis TaxID=3988 RepID=B9SVV4_RICCO|nr:hypothetical protein RCOM_0128070 [Ricinus communis]
MKELAGFYYDAEKNRYFPLKGPIPGSSSSSSKNNAQKPSSKPTQGINFCGRTRVRTSKLLQGRELNGNIIDFNKGKCNFMEEVLKKQASQPMVWKYQGTEKMADGALDQMHIHLQTPEGQTEVDVLVTGGTDGSLSLFEVGKSGQQFHNGLQFIPDRVGPVIEETKAECSKTPERTDLGAALVNLETGTATWVLRSKSDVLAQQLDQSGNVVLCGLRNGAIVTVDVREGSAREIRHRIPYSLLGRSRQNSSKQWFKLSGYIDPSCTWYMPSSICCLVSLQSYDQYFLSSSMDGSIRLYDHRMSKRGAIQSYEGHVNSHTRLQLEVDQSERFLMAGGEDCKFRLWSIKSGELLFEEKFSDAVLSTVCWQRPERCMRIPDENKSHEDCLSGLNNWGTWCGSQEGLFYMH